MTNPESLRSKCPRCGKRLGAAELIEQFCDDCGDLKRLPQPGGKEAA